MDSALHTIRTLKREAARGKEDVHGTPLWFPHTQSSVCGRLHGTENATFLPCHSCHDFQALLSGRDLRNISHVKYSKEKCNKNGKSHSEWKRAKAKPGRWLAAVDRCWLYKHEHPSLDPQNPQGGRKPDMVVHMES